MKYENAFIAFVLAGVRFALCMFECSDSQLFAIIINKVHYIREHKRSRECVT